MSLFSAPGGHSAARVNTRGLVAGVRTALDYLVGGQGQGLVVFILIWGALSFQIDVSSGKSHAPSLERELMPSYARQTSGQCKYPCDCGNRGDPLCKSGVSTVKDGCGCCHMCARQQGDRCDGKHVCDEEKGLYCQITQNEGICRARAAKPCEAGGNIYRDGEDFKLNCSQLCLCQNGQYTCSTLCPWEDFPPSTVHCKDPQLVKIGDNCCREWVCPHSHSLPDPTEFTPPEILPGACKRETSEWSACTQTCDMGVSIRLTNDNKNCETIQERRLCFVRPCTQEDKMFFGPDCKNTWRNGTSMRFVTDGCISVKDFRPKFCASCKTHRCCYPESSKTKEVEFDCNGIVKIKKFMWVKNCICKTCH